MSIYIKNKLNEELEGIIAEKVGDMNLVRKLNSAFAEKGLNVDTVRRLFDNTLDIEELNDIELITVANELYNYTHNKEINPEKYFSNSMISDFELYVPQVEEEINVVEFNNTIKTSSTTFISYLSAAELYQLRKHKLIAYYKSIQRSPRVVKLANGVVKTKTFVNKKSLSDLEERFIKGDIKETAISLVVILRDEKDQNIRFTGNGSIGNLKIKPDFDRESKHLTELIIADGFHRYTAITNAYERMQKEGKELNSGLGVFIYVMTQEEARQFIADTFKRSDTDAGWLNALETTKENIFADKLIQNSIILNGNTTNTLSECKKMNKLTYKNIISESTKKCTDIEISNELKSEFAARKMAKTIDNLIELVKEEIFDNNEDRFRNSWLGQVNTIVGYITIANEIRNNNLDELDTILKFISNTKNKKINSTEIIRELKLNSSSCKVDNIYNYFKDMIE